MKRTLLTALASLLLTVAASAADNASQILDQAAAKFTSAPSISAAYTITGSAGRYTGRVSFAGDKFTMTSPQILTWYDGTTQWSYNKDDNEVSITEPTAAELSQINPFVIINKFRNDFDCKSLTAPKGFKKIELTAKTSDSDVASATVTLSEKTSMPTQIHLVMRDKQQITILLTSVTTGQKYNIKAFQFYAPNYPGVKTVDLR